MGSSPTLAHPAGGHDPTDPAARAAEDAYGRLNPSMAFAWPNPYRPGVRLDELPRTRPDGPQTRRDLVRMFEEISARGYRVWLDEANESPPSPVHVRLAVLRYRAEHAQQLVAERARHARTDAEAAFDQLNPDYGVPADTRDPTGRRALHDREAGLALGPRVAVAISRENDPNPPFIRTAGQDYRVADAARAARQTTTRSQRRGPERGGPER